MTDTTTLTVRTKKHIKEQAQEFFDGIGISLSTAINMFLVDVASNQKLSFFVERVVLTPSTFDDMPSDAQTSYQELEHMNTDELVYFSAHGDDHS